MQAKLPEQFVKRLENWYPKNYLQIIETFSHKKPTTFRVNTLKIEEQKLIAKLELQGYIVRKAQENGYILENKSQKNLTETEEYKNGEIYIQGLSSMLPPMELAPQPGETVLDACAAPGSKTTQMAALMQNKGIIYACDLSKIRLYKLYANLKTLGAGNVKVLKINAKDLWKKFPETFDKVLVDAPCSLEGRFLVDSPKTYSNWSLKKIKILSDHQKHILRSAVTCAKKGATIVYSTCTLSKEENEEVAAWILEKSPEIELISMRTILPTPEAEAFFIAKFIKKKT